MRSALVPEVGINKREAVAAHSSQTSETCETVLASAGQLQSFC